VIHRVARASTEESALLSETNVKKSSARVVDASFALLCNSNVTGATINVSANFLRY
jgi:hypothetical protein